MPAYPTPLRKKRFSLQLDESTIHGQALLLVYVRIINNGSICEEMLFLKSLPEKTTGAYIFDEVIQYLNDKEISLQNLIHVASDGAASMIGKNKGFVSRLKEVAPHITHIHCILHRQHLAAKELGGDMETSLNIAVAIINFIKANPLHQRQFNFFCNEAEYNTLIMHTDVRWLSKGNSLNRLVNLWAQVENFLCYKSDPTNNQTKKQCNKASDLLENMRNCSIKAKIFYLSDIFEYINNFNKQLQGKNGDLVSCSEKIKGFLRKAKFWKSQLQKQSLELFSNLKLTNPSQEILNDCGKHLDGLILNLNERFQDILKIKYPLWYSDLDKYDYFEDSITKPDIIESLLDLKENKKLLNSVNKEGINGYLNIIDTHSGVFAIFDPFIISFPTTWLVEAGFSVVLYVFSNRRSSLDINKRGNIRIKLNFSIEIKYDELCASHQEQKIH